jgi:hypothetical protein
VILTSWKEIAAYLKKGVRTVQRWELDFNLPVRRPSRNNRHAVIALSHEIDAWVAVQARRGCSTSESVNSESLDQLLIEIEGLRREREHLTREVEALRAQLSNRNDMLAVSSPVLAMEAQKVAVHSGDGYRRKVRINSLG